MTNPQDAFNNRLTKGDNAELIKAVKTDAYTLPKGTVVQGLHYWSDNEHVQFHEVAVQGKFVDVVIHVRCLKRL